MVQNITFENGYDGTDQATCTANAPRCWYGGGAIYVEGGQFKAVNARFLDNRCYAYGPDLGGGAIRALAQYENRPVYITGDTIAGTVMANNRAREGGGAVFDVVDTGWGALTFAQSRLHDNISGEFQTFPGVCYDLDGHDRAPVMIRSTDG